MNLSERKRAEAYAKERYEVGKRKLPPVPEPTPPANVEKLLSTAQRAIEQIRAAGWDVSADYYSRVETLTLKPNRAAEEAQRVATKERDEAYANKRDALIARIWDGEITFSEIERELR